MRNLELLASYSKRYHTCEGHRHGDGYGFDLGDGGGNGNLVGNEHHYAGDGLGVMIFSDVGDGFGDGYGNSDGSGNSRI